MIDRKADDVKRNPNIDSLFEAGPMVLMRTPVGSIERLRDDIRPECSKQDSENTHTSIRGMGGSRILETIYDKTFYGR